MSFDAQDLLLRLGLIYLPLVASLALHEFAHAAAAVALGDETPREQGRLTPNPMVHLDLVGSVLLPVLFVALHLSPFGWARPVQVSPHRFHRGVKMHVGMMLTAFAGPAMNLLLAAVAGVGFAFATGAISVLVWRELLTLNVLLFLFNLLPVPPLDGSRVMSGLLPLSMRDGYRRLERFAPAFLGLLFFTNVAGRFLTPAAQSLVDAFVSFGRFFSP